MTEIAQSSENVIVETTDQNRSSRQKSENQYAQYLQGVQTPVMAINREFSVVYINDFGAKMLGLTPEQAKGKKCYDLFKTTDCRTAKCACAIAMKAGSPATSETIAHPGDKEVHIQYTGSPVFDNAGNIVGAVEFVTDITNLKAAIARSEQQVQYLKGIPTPVMAIDKEFTVTYMNDFGAKMLGYTSEEVIGKKCYELFKTDDCKTSKCACAIAMKTKKAATSETIARPGDNDIHIQYTGSPLYDESGKVIGAIEAVMDITKLKEMMTLIESIIKSANDVSGVVENLSDEILKASQGVGDVGNQLAQAAEKLSSSMQQVQSASQNVSEGAQNLSKLAQDTAKTVENLMALMNEVNKRTEEVNSLVNNSTTLSFKVSESGKQALGSLDDIKNATFDVIKTINEVNATVKNVAGLANDISEIAGQVNMLALNAAIEAARAGEAGRGFAVVADAVKQLAGQTGTAAKTAVESMDGITKSGTKAAEIAQKAGQVAEKGGVVVTEAVKGSQQVAESMNSVIRITETLKSNVEKTVKSLEEVNSTIQQVASFSEESASAAEESAASVEEQTAATEQVSAAAQKLREESNKAIDLAKKIVMEVKKLREELAKAKRSK